MTGIGPWGYAATVLIVVLSVFWLYRQIRQKRDLERKVKELEDAVKAAHHDRDPDEPFPVMRDAPTVPPPNDTTAQGRAAGL